MTVMKRSRRSSARHYALCMMFVGWFTRTTDVSTQQSNAHYSLEGSFFFI